LQIQIRPASIVDEVRERIGTARELLLAFATARGRIEFGIGVIVVAFGVPVWTGFSIELGIGLVVAGGIACVHSVVTFAVEERRRRVSLDQLARAAFERVVDAPLLARARPELGFWRPNWNVTVGTLANEGFDGLPGSDETWRHVYAAVADDLADLHRAFSDASFANLPDLRETDRAIVGRLLTALSSATGRARQMSGLSAETGWRWHNKSDDHLAAHRESEPVREVHRQVYPLWRDDLGAVVSSAVEIRTLAGS